MSENSDSQEKTEDPSSKRKQDAKEKGQVPRSKELNTTFVLMVSALGLYAFSSNMSDTIFATLRDNLTITAEELKNPQFIWEQLVICLKLNLMAFLPFFIMVFIGIIMSTIVIGGWSFSIKSLHFQLERMDPIKGVKKIFSSKGLIELVKSILKVLVVAGVGVTVFYLQSDKILTLSNYPIGYALIEALEITVLSAFAISAATILIALVDVPYQIWAHTKQIRMSKQELKDEMKETEGKPEVKSRIRQLQREIAKRRMMDKIAEADVVITNPDHFAIALEYKQGSTPAPVVVAKGLDLIAEKIKIKAREHKVAIVEAPPLARALYYSTELQDEIPSELYMAVAQVLSYVYQLKAYKRGQGAKPHLNDNFNIPQHLKR